MSVNISLYRARVGRYHGTAARLSQKFTHFKDVIAILILLNFGLSTALLFYFNSHTIDTLITCDTTPNRNVGIPKHCTVKTPPSDKRDIMFFSNLHTYFSNILAVLTMLLLILLCGDVHPNPGPTENNSSMSIVHNNICSLEHKTLFIEAELNKFDIITISETWLYDGITNDKIHINGFLPPIRRDTSGNAGYRGVAIYVKEDLICIHRPDLEVQDLEAVWFDTKINQETLLVGCFYRAPDTRVGYWTLIDESIRKAGNTPHKLVILGDFNADIGGQIISPHLTRIMNLNNLLQLINEPTRITDNTAKKTDLIFTTCPNLVRNSGVLPSVKSDHCCVFVELKCKKETNSSFKRTIYNYDKLDIEKFKDMLTNVDWHEIIFNGGLDEAAETFTSILMNSAKQCMPSKRVKIKENDAPWMNEEIRKLMVKKLYIHTLAKRLDSLWCWDLFKTLRNKLTTLIRKRKDDYFTDMQERINKPNCFGTKDWWKLLDRFSSRKGISESSIPPIEYNNEIFYSNLKKAEIFNNYFLSQSQLNNADDIVPTIPANETIVPDLIVTSTMVNTVISNLELNKAAGPDGVHNKILKSVVDIISGPLAVLFNRSIEETTFPAIWKKANVTPIYKKGEKHLCKNYRPISLLSCIGKVMERCVHKHIFKFLTDNSILTISQSGFIPKDSTSFQLLTMYDDFCKALDNQSITQAIFFDISKAFDRVWHLGLIRKLYSAGIRGPLLDWLRNYLTNRQQAVVIKGDMSTYKTVPAGVPQGSVLGPLLFLIYINDIVEGIESNIKLFADDTSIYFCFDDVERRTNTLNSDMKKINDWAKKWKVDFNPAKTELITITNKRNPETRPLIFGDTTLESKPEHKHLGVILQNNCKWDKHINFIVTKARLQVACLRSYKYKLSRKTLEIMYKSFILPHFDYADTVWDNCSTLLSDELEKINLDAIRTILGAVRGTSHQKLYDESGILPLIERRRRHKLTLFFKMTKKLTPTYLNNCLPPLMSEINPYHRRNPLDRLIPRPRLELYKQSFFPSTTILWNSLPDYVKLSDSLAEFKRYLSTNDIRVPIYYYSSNRVSEIVHCKLRLEISDLNADLYKRHLTGNMSCVCGSPIENADHFLLVCPLFDIIRRETIYRIKNFPAISTKQLTHGDPDISPQDNTEMFEKVQDFILKSRRFI